LAAGLFFLCVGCADFHRGRAPLDGGASLDASSADRDLAFETLVYPILELRCSGCHSVGGMAEYTRLDLTGNARLDRPMVVTLVTPGSPSDSLLLLRASGEAHTGGQVLSAGTPEYQTIADWILGLP
jgi:hypothetical protein